MASIVLIMAFSRIEGSYLSSIYSTFARAFRGIQILKINDYINKCVNGFGELRVLICGLQLAEGFYRW